MADHPLDNNQAEPSDISHALDVEQLDLNLYRSRNLSLPFEARGVFGGQVISQALVAATRCVKPEFALHSYFLLSASASAPLLYYVDRVRDGRSYSTRAVRAVQGGRTVFIMLCSFQIPEFWHPSRQWTVPQAPRPEECEMDVVHIRRWAEQPDQTREGRMRLLALAKAQESPVSVKFAGDSINELDGRWRFMYWMKAKTTRQYPAAFQKKCILAYITDTYFLPVASNISRLKRSVSEGPTAFGMASSLDHSVVYYKNDFDCGDWLLFVMTSPAAAMGRAFCSGLLYSKDGALLAVVNQEGVLRTKIRAPNEVTSQTKARL
ncbi:thioesterase II [Russula earlei]|uniref:Thioesterase II n=1 Tax=Russula earlei TaxID=71964 RepID=A0ACC0UL65_9AGAM|nr:thioesterase II [Russula earlei]